MDGSPSVSEVYMRRDTAVSGAFLHRRKKPHIVPVATPALGRPDMPFLDFWSTSSALYESDEGFKDAATVVASFVRLFSALQERSRNGCVTPQIRLKNTRRATHTFISMPSAIVVSFMASEQGGVRLMRARVHLV